MVYISFLAVMIFNSNYVTGSDVAVFDTMVLNSNKFYDTILTNAQLKEQNQVTTIKSLSHRMENYVNRFPEGEQDNLKTEIVNMAKTAGLVVDPSVVSLAKKVLAYFQNDETPEIKNFFQPLSIHDYVHRLFEKRYLVKFNPTDETLLRTGEFGCGGMSKMEQGKDNTEWWKNYLFPQEEELSALFGLSSESVFVNQMHRGNRGVPSTQDDYEKKGYIAGLVGARFEELNLMEFRHMMIAKHQNTIEKGYGLSNKNPDRWLSMWAQFYTQEKNYRTYDEVLEYVKNNKEQTRYKQLWSNGIISKTQSANPYNRSEVNAYKTKYPSELKMGEIIYLDTEIYKERLKKTIFPFLLKANQTGKKLNKEVVAYVVGLGLGAWQVDPCQEGLMLETYLDIIQQNKQKLESIKHLHFGYFSSPAQTFWQDLLKKKGVEKESLGMEFSFSTYVGGEYGGGRNPAEKLKDNDVDRLPFCMYAWDGGTYPGNEYYLNLLQASGDPSAAAASLITELHNVKINPYLSDAMKEEINERLEFLKKYKKLLDQGMSVEQILAQEDTDKQKGEVLDPEANNLNLVLLSSSSLGSAVDAGQGVPRNDSDRNNILGDTLAGFENCTEASRLSNVLNDSRDDEFVVQMNQLKYILDLKYESFPRIVIKKLFNQDSLAPGLEGTEDAFNETVDSDLIAAVSFFGDFAADSVSIKFAVSNKKPFVVLYSMDNGQTYKSVIHQEKFNPSECYITMTITFDGKLAENNNNQELLQQIQEKKLFVYHNQDRAEGFNFTYLSSRKFQELTPSANPKPKESKEPEKSYFYHKVIGSGLTFAGLLIIINHYSNGALLNTVLSTMSSFSLPSFLSFLKYRTA